MKVYKKYPYHISKLTVTSIINFKCFAIIFSKRPRKLIWSHPEVFQTYENFQIFQTFFLKCVENIKNSMCNAKQKNY